MYGTLVSLAVDIVAVNTPHSMTIFLCNKIDAVPGHCTSTFTLTEQAAVHVLLATLILIRPSHHANRGRSVVPICT